MLIIAVALTLWAAFVSDKVSDDDVTLVAERKTALTAKRNTNANIELKNTRANNIGSRPNMLNKKTNNSLIPWQLLDRQQLVNNEQFDKKPIDIFKVYSWLEAPRVVKSALVQLPAPVKPVAPMAPFTYMGQMQDTPKGTQVFLLNNNVLVSVVKGEKINQQWRFDTQDETSLRLTYLPLNLPQILYKTAIAADAQTPALIPDTNQPNSSQPDASSLNTDPPDTSELGLEELRL